MSASHGISVALLRPLAELLGRLELDAPGFLRSLGIDDGTTPETYVPGELVDAALEQIATAADDPAFALSLARAAAARPLGLFGHMVWLSGTLRDALTRAAKFYAMVTRRTTLALDEEAGLASLRQRPVKGISHGPILTEYAFASLALRARHATRGRFALRAVRFMHAGRELDVYREVFGAPVTFGAPLDELAFDAVQLDLELEGSDPITSAALEVKVAQLASASLGRSPFLDRVRRATVASLDEDASLTGVARRLGISGRTLRRHLEQEGSSLRAVIDEVRCERADALLASGRPVKEVAFSLGFSEPSAFSRAYKRWTGRAPKAATPR